MLDREQPADIEMLPGLRLDAFVRRNDEQHQVDSAYAGQHVAHEAFVTGYIHKSESEYFATRPRQFKMSKSDVDGDSAPLLFLKAIRVDAGKCLDQRSFSVIDVAAVSMMTDFMGPSIAVLFSGSGL